MTGSDEFLEVLEIEITSDGNADIVRKNDQLEDIANR